MTTKSFYTKGYASCFLLNTKLKHSIVKVATSEWPYRHKVSPADEGVELSDHRAPRTSDIRKVWRIENSDEVAYRKSAARQFFTRCWDSRADRFC